jgi:hypothetical protein
MRKSLVSVTVMIALGAGIAGCGSAWWQQVTSNPALDVQTFESAIQIAVNAAQLAWPAILSAIPAANQVVANQQFQNAVSAVNHGEQVLNDAVNAAAAVGQTNPNFTALMQAVSDAVGQVVAIVSTYTVPVPATDAGAPSVSNPAAPSISAGDVADLHAAYVSLTRWGVTVR